MNGRNTVRFITKYKKKLAETDINIRETNLLKSYLNS